QAAKRTHGAGQIAVHMQNACCAGRLEVRYFRKIYRPLGGTTLYKAHQLFSNLFSDVFLRLLRAATNVWRKNNVTQADKRAVKRLVDAFGLGGENIDGGSGKVTGMQRLA